MIDKTKLEHSEDAMEEKVKAEKEGPSTLEIVMKYLDARELGLPNFSKSDLIEKACAHYDPILIQDNLTSPYPSSQKPDETSNPFFLERISVNYIKEYLSTFENKLAQVFGIEAVNKGYKHIQTRILMEIGTQYRWLAEECKRQQQGL